MASLSKLFYIPIRATLPRLRRRLSSKRTLDEFDESVNLLLEGGIARNWTNARRMVKASKKSVDELFWELSEPYTPNWRRRLRFWLIGLTGGYTHDPHQRELKALQEKGGDAKPRLYL